jgi:hypothetical protein
MHRLSFRTCLLLFVLSAAYVVGGSLWDNQRFAQHFKEFDRANLKGRLAFVGPAYKGVAITLQGTAQKLFFYPYADQQLNGNQSFLGVARAGDYVEKRVHSDTLVLLTAQQRYRYLFKVPGKSFMLPYR